MRLIQAFCLRRYMYPPAAARMAKTARAGQSRDRAAGLIVTGIFMLSEITVSP